MGLLSHWHDAEARNTPAFQRHVRLTNEMTPRAAVAAKRAFYSNCLSCWRTELVDLLRFTAGTDADKPLVSVLVAGACSNCAAKEIIFASEGGDDELKAPVIFGRFGKQSEILRRGRATILASTRITTIPYGWDYSDDQRGFRVPYLDLKGDPTKIDILPEVRQALTAGRMICESPQCGGALRNLIFGINSIDALSTLACSWERGTVRTSGGDDGHAVESWVEVARVPLTMNTYEATFSLARALLDQLHATPSGCIHSLNIAFAVSAAKVLPVLQAETIAVSASARAAFLKWERGVRELTEAIIAIVEGDQDEECRLD